MGAPIISPIPKVTVGSPDSSANEIIKKNFKRGYPIQGGVLFKVRVGGVPLPTMYHVFNFTSMKILQISFFLSLSTFHFFNQMIALK